MAGGCEVATREVRAQFDATSIRVYQAYAPGIADRAVVEQTFKPPFSRERMTWIKPSFMWMMYRSGWARKQGQDRVLAIDIRRDGFEWALANAALSHFESAIYSSEAEWRHDLSVSPVRIQWDPERGVRLEALHLRAIQVGLSGVAVDAYVDEWICRIEDVTALAREVQELVQKGDLDAAESLRPLETYYELKPEIAARIGCVA